MPGIRPRPSGDCQVQSVGGQIAGRDHPDEPFLLEVGESTESLLHRDGQVADVGVEHIDVIGSQPSQAAENLVAGTPERAAAPMPEMSSQGRAAAVSGSGWPASTQTVIAANGCGVRH